MARCSDPRHRFTVGLLRVPAWRTHSPDGQNQSARRGETDSADGAGRNLGLADPFAPAAADTQHQLLNPSRSARLGRYLMERAMILIVCAVVAIAALMFAAWAAEPGVRITWRKGEGWTAHREGWSGLEANTTV